MDYVSLFLGGLALSVLALVYFFLRCLTVREDKPLPLDCKLAGGAVLFGIFMMLFLAFTRPAPELVSSQTLNVEITDVDGPKHVYVDLKDVDSGVIYKHVYVSKHFNDWRAKLVTGRRVTVTRQVWRHPDNQGEFVRWPGLYQTLR